MNFIEYMYSSSNLERLTIMNFLSQYGDPNVLLKEIFDTSPCYQDKRIDIRVTKDFLVWFKDGFLLSKPRRQIVKLTEDVYCRCTIVDYISADIVLESDSLYKFIPTMNKKDALPVFNELKKYARGFENIEPYESQETAPDVEFVCRGLGSHYCFKGGSLYREERNSWNGKIEKQKILVYDMQNIIWCEEGLRLDPESSDSYWLSLYVDKENGACVLLDSQDDVFKFAIELKKRVPHLLYGPSEEYEKIFKRNPAELMVIAKNKIQNKSFKTE